MGTSQSREGGSCRALLRVVLTAAAPPHRSCICSDHCSTEACYAGDVNALLSYGYDAVKVRGDAQHAGCVMCQRTSGSGCIAVWPRRRVALAVIAVHARYLYTRSPPSQP